MNEQPPPPIGQVVITNNKRNHKAALVALIVVLALIAVGGVGYSVYALQQNSSLRSDISQKEAESQKLIDENTSLKSSLEEANKGKVVPTDKQLAQKAAQDFVDAQVLGVKHEATSLAIKGGFASASVAPANRKNHVVSELILKKVNKNWVVVHYGQNSPTEDVVLRFAIPKEFQN